MFKKFALGDVFNIYSPKKRFNANAVQFGGKYPYVARGSSNNGIRGYITEDEQYLSPAKSLSFGQDTATVFYQPDAYFTGDKIKVMVLNNLDLNDELAQYFITVKTKSFSTFAWGQSSFNEKILKATEIILPVIESPDLDHEYTVDDIDFEYMQERIAELEQERIAELDAYLAASGLDDYELTDEDKEILSLSSESASDEAGAPEVDCEDGQVVFKAFAMHDIFEPLRVTKAKKSQLSKVRTKEFCVPVVYAKFGDNGIMYWGKKGEFTTYENVISIVYNGVISAGKVYAQEEPTGILAESYLIRYKYGTVPFLANLYMSRVIEHRIYPLYSRENLATWNGRVENETIELPVTADGNIDFDYMERYIRAIEKLAIADVVKYKDKLIAMTRRVVGA